MHYTCERKAVGACIKRLQVSLPGSSPSKLGGSQNMEGYDGTYGFLPQI